MYIQSKQERLDEDKARRLKRACDFLIAQGYSRSYAAIAKSLGYKSSTSFSHILNNVVPLPGKLLDKIDILFPQINANWIDSGEGEMLREASRMENPEELRDEKKVKRLLKYLYAENIPIGDALKQLDWTRYNYEIALQDDLTEKQVRQVEQVYTNLNMEWFVYGTGPMTRAVPDSLYSIMKNIQNEIEALRGKINRIEKRMEQL